MSLAGYEKNALQKALDETPYKTTYFAERLGLTPNSFRHFARNPHTVTHERAGLLAEILGKSREEVIELCRSGK